MNFVNVRKSTATHLYFAYVFAEDGKPSCLWQLGSVMDFKRKMRDRHRKFEIIKVW